LTRSDRRDLLSGPAELFDGRRRIGDLGSLFFSASSDQITKSTAWVIVSTAVVDCLAAADASSEAAASALLVMAPPEIRWRKLSIARERKPQHSFNVVTPLVVARKKDPAEARSLF
jgi:hypothetical protein